MRRPSGRFITATKVIYPAGAYRLPTGGIGAGEGIAEALGREVREETSLDVEVRRFLAAIAYRRAGTYAFATFAFLLDETGGTLGARDPAERIATWREIPPSELAGVAATLEAVPNDANAEIPNWRSWGRFRAHVHRAVHDALASSSGT